MNCCTNSSTNWIWKRRGSADPRKRVVRRLARPGRRLADRNREQQLCEKPSPFGSNRSLTFRPTSRRTEQAGCLCYPESISKKIARSPFRRFQEHHQVGQFLTVELFIQSGWHD